MYTGIDFQLICVRGVNLSKESFKYPYKTVKRIIFERIEMLRKDYPHTVDIAYKLVEDYLQKYDRKRLLIFRGECAGEETVVSRLLFALTCISGFLEEERLGNPNVTPLTKDVFCRLYLQLPSKVIEGGAQ